MSTALPQIFPRGGRKPQTRAAALHAFTILELLVAMSVLLIILLIIFSITQQTGNAWKSTNSKIEAFQRARAAFEAITQNLGQATLNTYYDYQYENDIPKRYYRKSDLHFLSGKSQVTDQVGHSVFFQTPAGYTSDDPNYQGMDTLLNACGYFVKYDKDTTIPPFLATLPNKPADKYRYRLYQFLQPSQNLSVYESTSGVYESTSDKKWFTNPLSSTNPPTQQIADNIVTLLIIPKNPQGTDLSTDFEYDSRGWDPLSGTPQPTASNQLPPVVEVIMVAIDENSANRICTSTSAPFTASSSGSVDQILTDLEKNLNDRHLNFRVFRTTVALRNSKWSS